MSHKFTLPGLPASMNNIYQIIYGLRKVELRPEVRLWKTTIKQYIPPWEEVEERLLWISFEFHGNWFTSKGKVRVIDHANLEKITIDVIAEKLKFNDSLIFEKRMSRKVQSEKERIEVELGFI